MMICRTRSHVVDTIAIRSVISSLPNDWLVRGLEERDYGIDLTIEVFNGSRPTGNIAMIQVKGTEKEKGKVIKVTDFPTKTLAYSLLFQEPFFIFKTFVNTNETYFVWAQKYAKCVLDMNSKTKNWRDKSTVTIQFPTGNSLHDGLSKISAILGKYEARREAFEYFKHFEWLSIHFRSVKLGEFGLINSCIDDLANLFENDVFISNYSWGAKSIDQAQIRQLFLNLNSSSGGNSTLQSGLFDQIEDYLERLDGLRIAFLEESDFDAFVAANVKEYDTPY